MNSPRVGGDSPYTAEARAGVWGMGHRFASSNRILHGWIQLLNTGPDMPHLVIRVGARNSFTVSRKFGQFHTASGKYQTTGKWLGKHVSPFVWDFGRFPAGSVATIRFRMRLSHHCSYDMQLLAFGNTTGSQSYDPNAAIWNVGEETGGSYGPCP